MIIPSPIGIGLRPLHYQQVLKERPHVGWFEVHSENFFHLGGPAIDMLTEIRQHYALSLHGVGLSLGSAQGVQIEHLIRLNALIHNVDPFLISEHLSWSRIGNVTMPDLLPVPYHAQSLEIFCDNINYTQDFLGREILIENPSSYLEYKASDQQEVDFLVSLCERTGARILLDINNIFVSCHNHGWDPIKYINSIPKDYIKELHIAGHSMKTIGTDKVLRIDTHDHPVCPEVWELYQLAIQRFGILPTLLEWDAHIPDLSFLIREASKALTYINLSEKSYDYA